MKRVSLLITLFAFFTLNAQENYNLTVRGHLTFPGKELANIGGYVDSLGNEYALVGTTAGLSIVDVSNPDNPILSFEVTGVESIWREVKTWNGFAYVTTEGANGGLTIIDLRELPNAINSHVYRGDGVILNQLSKSHTLHIDNGYCYVYGSNIGEGGALFLDLTDPWNPVYQGKYDERYIHDGIVSGDTIWGSHIYDGFYSAIDVSDKSNPVTLITQTTPGNFTHNTWLSNNHNTLFTTDEVPNSYLTSYNIDVLGNISELDRYQTAPGSNCIVHNTHILNDYAVTSWYTEGVVIVDGARPANLIEVAKNDFSSYEGNTFNGCWGVYPFLPSGNLIASDIEGGLYVLTPTYVRGCYLEGIVRDSSCGALLDNVTVSIVEAGISELTGIDGTYRTGTAFPGTYTITFSKPGYNTYTISNVVLANGVLTEFEINLFSPSGFALNGNVESSTGSVIESALVSLSNANSGIQLSTDNQGNYSKCDLVPDTYQLAIGKWGFETLCTPQISIDNSISTIQSTLIANYYDDFQFNYGWIVTSTSTTGIFERAIPVATNLNGIASNPGTDYSGDCNGYAYVTGNNAGTSAGNDDVDDGYTRLTSPIMDLSSYIEPTIWYDRWFFNGGGNDAINDTLFIRLINNGGSPVTIKKIIQGTNSSQWVSESIQVKDFIPNPGQVRFVMEAVDSPNGHIVEAGLDHFYVVDSVTTNIVSVLNDDLILKAYPIPSDGLVNVYYQTKLYSNFLKLNVTDLSGRIIQREILSGNEGTIQLGNGLPSGIYFIQILSDGYILTTKRVVIAH